MVKYNGSGIFFKNLRRIGIFDHRLCFNNISNSVEGHLRTGNHDKHDGDHDKGDDNLHGVLHIGHHITNLQCSRFNLMAADPDDQHGYTVHEQHH
jgi:hypothetical protein